jgi:UDP-glucose 4-epimerase
MKIGVTGGAGFIGSNLVRKLLELNHEIIVVDDLSTGVGENLDRLEVDFRNISVENNLDLSKALSSCEVIYHLAARGSVSRSILDPVATYKVNLTGTLNILEIARNSGAHVIYSSSSSVYGSNNSQPKSEQSWVSPISPYGASKLSSEAFLSAYAHSYNIAVTNFRFFNVFGPFQRPDHIYSAVIPKWIRLALLGEEIEVYGDGEQKRDFTYIDTVTRVVTSALSKIAANGEVINLAYGNSISLNDIITKLKNEFPSLDVRYVSARQSDIKNSRNFPERLNTYFPEIIPTDFEVGFEKTFYWLKKNLIKGAN